MVCASENSRSAGVAVVIPTYNSRRWIDGCLESILGGGEAEVVQVVDNGSSDGTLAHLEARWPGVMVLALEANVGYGAAVNAGAELWPGRDVLALNADTVLRPGALAALRRTMAAGERVGVVAPRLLNADGSPQPSAHPEPSLAHLARHALGLVPEASTGSEGEPFEVAWATGAALLIRRTAWDEVGGFDPAYRFFVEEVDLQARLRDRGWSVVLEPAARVEHFGGARPIEASLFALSHDGWERYFGVRHGPAQQVLVRALLCLVAASRLGLWGARALLRRRGREEATSWARMFAGATALSALRLPGAALRRHPPYAPQARS